MEIERAINSIGFIRREESASQGIIIGERPASYIPDSVFDAFNDKAVSLTEKETSSPSLNERRQIIIRALQKALDIPHWPRIEKVHIDILEAAEAMYVDGKWISDDELLRKVQLLALFSLDPKNYSPSDASVMKRKSSSLSRALIAEFKKRGKHDLAAKLEQSRDHPSGQYKPVKH